MNGILITGAHGFLGHHVVKAFEGYKVLTPTRQELNLLHTEELAYYMHDNRPDIVIHLAAQCGGIGINREKPAEFLYNNLMMTTNLIQSCWRNNRFVKKFVGVGTVCSYPKFTPVPFREEDLYDGYPEETNAPYGLAKRMQLEMLRAYRAQYGFNGICLIPTNMIGEYDNFKDESSHVVPALLKKFHHAKMNKDPSVTLWGDGSATREFLYAGDCADAILKATQLYNKPDPINIGTGTEISIKDLATNISNMIGYEGEILWDTTKPNGQPRRCLDVSKAKMEFGFEAKSNLYEVLLKTYLWAKGNNVL